MTDELYKVLWDYDAKKNKIKEIESQILELQTRLMPSGIRYDKDKVQTSPMDAMSEIEIKKIELEKKREQLKIDAFHSFNNLVALIEKVPDPIERQMANYHYINGMSWAKITEILNYANESTIYYHRRNLIRELEKLVVISSIDT